MGINDVHSFTICIKSSVESKICNVLHHVAAMSYFLILYWENSNKRLKCG